MLRLLHYASSLYQWICLFVFADYKLLLLLLPEIIIIVITIVTVSITTAVTAQL
jgi:hypothetical protein